MLTPFHLALNVTDLDLARRFYGQILGCQEGRSTDTWVDFNFFGHQLSLHLGRVLSTENTGKVGEHKVPMPHFGVILPQDQWQAIAEKLKGEDIEFVIKPSLRFAGQAGEQHTLFFLDPFGNPIEIKGFQTTQQVFAQ